MKQTKTARDVLDKLLNKAAWINSRTKTGIVNGYNVREEALDTALKELRRIMPKKMINAGFTSKAYLEGYNDALKAVRMRAK